MIAQLVAGPLMGLVIGYITNNLAIKMLFRPLNPIYIGSFRLPFTPGLIPKEKKRIASVIGSMVSKDLLDSKTVAEALLSDKIVGSISGLVDRAIDKMKTDDETLRELLYQKTDDELVDSLIERLSDDVTELIHTRLSKFNFGAEISRKVIINIRDKYSEGGSLKAMFARMLDDSVIESIAEPLGKTIDRLVSENSETIVGDTLDKEIDRILDTKVSVLAERLEARKPRIKQAVTEIYTRTIRNDLPKIMEIVDIAAIVENKINDLDNLALEQMILRAINKELKAIVWLGALLGFLMGFVNVFVGLIF